MRTLDRRSAVIGGALALAAPAVVRAQSLGSRARVVVIGAGVFGAWTAEHLRRGGATVLLVDAWGPAHTRASSGGESRMTRAAYGRDAIYARMARDSLTEWKGLSAGAGLPIFHHTGVLFFFPGRDDYALQSIAAHRALGLPTQLIEARDLERRWPQVDWSGVAIGVWEPGFGVLMARRAVQTLVERYVAAGGVYEQAIVNRPSAAGAKMGRIALGNGRLVEGDAFVFACGPWLPKLFPALLGRRIFPTRQEVFFFATQAGDDRFGPRKLPGWADFNGGKVWYGMPDLEARGFKIAFDGHGAPADPDTLDRRPGAAGLAAARAFMARRFPALAGAPLAEARVCQYENSANGNFLIDRHPQWRDVVLVGGGSGHGFKHGPEVGRYAAALATGALTRAERRFSLASKAQVQARAVH